VGLLDFPVWWMGNAFSLCWKLGEPHRISHTGTARMKGSRTQIHYDTESAQETQFREAELVPTKVESIHESFLKTIYWRGRLRSSPGGTSGICLTVAERLPNKARSSFWSG